MTPAMQVLLQEDIYKSSSAQVTAMNPGQVQSCQEHFSINCLYSLV